MAISNKKDREKWQQFVQYYSDNLSIADIDKLLLPSSFKEVLDDEPTREMQLESLTIMANNARKTHESLAKARKWLKKAIKLEKKHEIL